MTWALRYPERRWSRSGGSQSRWSRSSRGSRTSTRSRTVLCGARWDRSILVVDDDDYGRETLARILEVAGYQVQRAANGDEALQVLQGPSRPGLILLDLLMPRLDGWALAAQLQQDLTLGAIPVIVVSADTSQKGRDYPGIVARFEKPIVVPSLLASIERYLRQ